MTSGWTDEDVNDPVATCGDGVPFVGRSIVGTGSFAPSSDGPRPPCLNRTRSQRSGAEARAIPTLER